MLSTFLHLKPNIADLSVLEASSAGKKPTFACYVMNLLNVVRIVDVSVKVFSLEYSILFKDNDIDRAYTLKWNETSLKYIHCG